MSRINVVKLFSVIILTFGAHRLSATVTYAVGTCKPKMASFATISDALAATPAPNVVMVCPGTYNEQVVITQAVNLEGVATGDAGQAIIAVPSGGLVTNVLNDNGIPVAAQIAVTTATGPVSLSDITVDGAGNGVGDGTIVGVFYQNSPGTIDRVTTRNQVVGTGPTGIGMWIEGGGSNPSVVVENSSIHDFGGTGIHVEGNSETSELTATLKSNYIYSTSENATAGIVLELGTTSTVTSNFVAVSSGGATGISVQSGASGSVSGNTLTNNVIGIDIQGDGVSISGNKIFGNTLYGIQVLTSVALVKGNTITGGPVGIEFACYANPNVMSNIITDAATGTDQVPSGVSTSNSYFDVGSLRTGGC